MKLHSLFIKTTVFVNCITEVKNWHVPVSHYLGWRKKNDIIRFRNGIKCIIRNKSDATAFFEIFFLKTNNALKEFVIKKNDVIVDVGAHIGYFTIYAAKQASKGQVYAFEPHENSFSILQEHLRINGFGNVMAENLGVLKNSGTATLFVDENNSIGNNMFKNDILARKEIVTTISLQDIMDKHKLDKIDLLKLDCEGAEFEIILNLSPTYLKKIIKISAEIHPGVKNYNINDMCEFLKSNDFSVQYRYPLSDPVNSFPMLYAINNIHN